MFTKIKQIVLVVFLLSSAQFAQASSTFLIEDYIPQRFTDLLWTVDGDFSGSARNSRREADDPFMRNSTSKNSSGTYAFELNSKTRYQYETVTEYLDATLNVQTAFNSNSSNYFSRNDRNSQNNIKEIRKSEYSRKYSHFRISPQTTYSKYNKNDLFYSVSVKGIIDYNYSFKDVRMQESFNTTQNINFQENNLTRRLRDSNNDSRRYIGNFSFKIGSGRQYAGKYAFTAYNIIVGLRENGLLLKQPDKAIMIALTDIIYQYENTHTIDTRLKKIDQFDAIYNYLLKNKIVSENSHLECCWLKMHSRFFLLI